MPPTSTVTAASHAREFPEDFFVDNGKLICCFCDHRCFIPTSVALRRDYLPKLFEDHIKQLKEYFCGKCVSIIVDETTDCRARSVVNILFSYNGVTKLVHVDYLENVNNCTIGQLIIQILVQWGISFDLPQLVASDSVAEAWVSINHFQDVHQLLANIKQTFVYSKSQKVRYKSYLQRQGVSNPKNIPLSNTTRWNTWFRMAFHVYQNLDYIRGFYNEESKENSTPMIEKINSAFTDQQINERIKIYLAFIQENAQQFVADLDFFQQENKPIFPFIEQRLQQLEARITMGKTITNVGSTMDLVLQKFNSPLTAFCPIIRELANPSTSLIQEWSIYVNINLNLIEFSELNEFWDKVSLQLPLLEKIVRNYIWLPISSCAVERSFSAYNKILDDDRQNLSLESLKFLTMMYFNNQNSGK
ncbi:transcription factor E2F6 isoform X1 [Rhizophagus clarus]|uniref:Transcription factor E2F6 isoform X1 n=1 Tax=Rhizophagus clarus TaxID=94130 RepID=A0A8H3QNY9_9GLOM|nr:transcription factor E2F6 isoform X1 [Rhizophagus clarus]